MSTVRRDYKAPTARGDVLIASDADFVRTETGVEDAAYFNICDFISGPLALWLGRRRKARLRVCHFDAVLDQPWAFVSFQPGELILNADRGIWSDASIAEPESRYILGHEIGHLVLHSHYDSAFSRDPALQLAPFLDEESTEWQANRFAPHFLVPVRLARLLGSVSAIMSQCAVSREVAQERYAAAYPKPKADLSATLCNKCGGLIVTRDGAPDPCRGCEGS